jgi:large subunit ribosomal protein L30
MAKKLRITLTKSMNGRIPAQVRTARALGLRKIRQTVEKDDTPSIRGMVAAIGHMVSFEEVD